MNIAIIVTYHDGPQLLAACLDSLVRTVPASVDIFAILNNRNQAAIDVPVPGRVRAQRIPDNLGYAQAANLGANMAAGKDIVFVDGDVIVTPGWLEALLATRDEHPSAGAVAAKLVNPHSGRIIDFGLGFTRFNTPHLYLDRRPELLPAVGDFPVQAACSACLLCRRQHFDAIGGFHLELENLYTDIDICLRFKDVGAGVYMSDAAQVYHFGTEISRFTKAFKDSHLKADVKGRFWALNANRITIDMDSFIAAQVQALIKRTRTTRDYFVCQCMNVADPNWYVDIVHTYLPVNNVHHSPSRDRDAPLLSLYALLGHDIARQRIPIIYMVDRFVSLRENQVWWDMRRLMPDIVVDRHGNVLTVGEVLEDLQ